MLYIEVCTLIFSDNMRRELVVFLIILVLLVVVYIVQTTELRSDVSRGPGFIELYISLYESLYPWFHCPQSPFSSGPISWGSTRLG